MHSGRARSGATRMHRTAPVANGHKLRLAAGQLMESTGWEMGWLGNWVLSTHQILDPLVRSAGLSKAPPMASPATRTLPAFAPIGASVSKRPVQNHFVPPLGAA